MHGDIIDYRFVKNDHLGCKFSLCKCTIGVIYDW